MAWQFLKRNPYQASMRLVLGEDVFDLKLDFGRLVGLEQHLSTTLIDLSQKMAHKNLSLKEITAVLYAGLDDAQKNKISFEVFGQKVVNAGAAEALKYGAQFLVWALGGALEKKLLKTI